MSGSGDAWLWRGASGPSSARSCGSRRSSDQDHGRDVGFGGPGELAGLRIGARPDQAAQPALAAARPRRTWGHGGPAQLAVHLAGSLAVSRAKRFPLPPRLQAPPADLAVPGPAVASAAVAVATPGASAPEPPPDPEDWSDELAQVELELQRLGWGREQEAAYLERVFGHPSRGRLTRYADLGAYLGVLRRAPIGADPAALPAPCGAGTCWSSRICCWASSTGRPPRGGPSWSGTSP
ncbi:hypothetical protein [Cyanobium sp. ATX-6F1]|uniref:hypothetical protein n=1 Tax=Cyanobium sp. ATX-6F1 TaxID=3137388 RepID=UPI0039BE780D